MNAPRAIDTGSQVLDEIAGAIGEEAAFELARRFGGQRLYFPRSIGPDHDIAKAIGPTAAAELAANFHGTEFTIPMRVRKRLVVEELARRTPRLTRRQIADEAGLTEREVYRILKPRDDRQADLFAAD